MEIVYQIDEEKYHFTYPRLLFNTKKHRFLQAELSTWFSYYLKEPHSNKIRAEFHTCLDETRLNSPTKAPYSGFSCDPCLPLETFHNFVRETIESCELPYISKLTIKTPPQVIHSFSSLTQAQALANAGYSALQTDPHWFLFLDESKKYPDLINSKEYFRKLKKINSENFDSFIEPPDRLLEVFGFISKNMQAKGYNTSMSFSQFQQYVHQMPESLQAFSLVYKNERIAASICFKLHEAVLYDFMHAHNPDFNAHSPVIKIYETMYKYAKKQGMKYIDLGASSINNQPNYPLIRFKERAGGVMVNKLIWEKTLHKNQF